MGRAERIEAVEAALAEAEVELELLRARIEGHNAELSALRLGTSVQGEGLRVMRLTDAIMVVVGTGGASKSIPEICSALAAHGRDDSRKNVTATLSYLKGQGRLVSPSRGRFTLS